MEEKMQPGHLNSSIFYNWTLRFLGFFPRSYFPLTPSLPHLSVHSLFSYVGSSELLMPEPHRLGGADW